MTSKFSELQPDAEPLGAASGFFSEFMDAVAPTHFLDEFTRSETLQLTEYFETFGVPRDSVVIAEGDPGDFLIILVTGRASIFRKVGDLMHVLAEVQTGQFVGEVSFVDGRAREASCVTREPSDIALLTRENFQSLQAAHPRLANKLMMLLLQRSVARLRGDSSISSDSLV